LQEKAKQVGFEWENKEQVWEKVKEEENELLLAVNSWQSANDNAKKASEHKKVEEEFGDLIFSLVNYARFLQLDADNALERTNKKFIHRFTQMEQEALNTGQDLKNMSLQEMDAIWNRIKQQRE